MRNGLGYFFFDSAVCAQEKRKRREERKGAGERSREGGCFYEGKEGEE